MGIRYWIWFFFLIGSAWAQSGVCLKEVLQKIPATSPSGYSMLIQSAVSCAEGRQEVLPEIYLDLGIAFFRQGQPSTARACLDSVIRKAPEGSLLLAPAWRVKALSYEQEGDYYHAEAPYLKAVSAYSSQTGMASPLAASLKSLGNLYTRFGDFEQATFYLQQAISQYLQAQARPGRIAQAWVDLGEAYAWQDSLHAALRCYDSALALPGITPLEQGLAQLAAGRVNSLLGHSQQAGALVHAALSAFQQTGILAYIAECWQTRGELAMEAGNFPEARFALAQALEVNRQAYPNPYRRERAKILYSLGQLCLKEGNWEKSLGYYQQALGAVLPGHTDTLDVTSLPNPDFFYKENVILHALEGKMAAWQMAFREKKEAQYLHYTLATYEALIKIEDLLRFSYDYTSSKLLLAEASHQRAELGMEAAFSLWEFSGENRYKEMIFSFAERSKAVVLLEELRHLQGIETTLPDTIRHSLDQERFRLSELRQQRSLSPDDAGRDSLSQLLELQQQKVLRLIDSLEAAFPAYYRFKYAVDLPKIREIRTFLGTDRGMLAYFWGKQSLYAICLSQEEFHVARLKLPGAGQADSLMLGLTGYWLDTTLQKPKAWYDQLLGRQAWQWSQGIWMPLAGFLPARVIVIPDGPLGTLPFDALLSGPAPSGPSYRTWPFLLFSHTFSYAYSASWLLQLEKGPQERTKGWLAVAPLRWQNPGMAPLPWGEAETSALAGLPGKGTMLLGAQAQKDTFVSLTENSFQVIHFNTHARAFPSGTQESWIAFSDSGMAGTPFLSLTEIYQLQLPARLVVLSACETAAGEVAAGEGVMSLARGFAYSGGKSVLSTLWSLQDRPASWIIRDFYRRLGNGASKDEALRQSRLAFLESEDFTEREGHPYFWAAWMLTGDGRPLVSPSWWIFAVVTVSGIAGAGIWLLLRKRIKSA